jgi:hypothetical protein
VLGAFYFGQAYFADALIGDRSGPTPNDQLLQLGLGSTDWAGRNASFGGVHTGTCTITMQDGAQFTVASNRAEVLRKLDAHAVAPSAPSAPTAWIAFDVPSSAIPIVLNAQNVAQVT